LCPPVVLAPGEAEAGVLLEPKEFEASLGNIARLCVQRKKKKEKISYLYKARRIVLNLSD
jgi:hypothetical protein